MVENNYPHVPVLSEKAKETIANSFDFSWSSFLYVVLIIVLIGVLIYFAWNLFKKIRIYFLFKSLEKSIETNNKELAFKRYNSLRLIAENSKDFVLRNKILDSYNKLIGGAK